MIRIVHLAVLNGLLFIGFFYPVVADSRIPFSVGERLSYDIKLWGIKVGEMTSTVKEKTKIDGGDVYSIVVYIQSVGLAAKMYTLKDELHVYLDADTLDLRRSERYLHEGNWRAYVSVDFDRAGSQALFVERSGDKDGPITGSKIIYLPRRTLDATSLAYFIRGEKLEGRHSLNLSILYEAQPKDVEVSLMPRETVDLDGLGVFRAYVLKQMNNGNVTLWLSDDDRRLPVKIVAASIKVAGWRVIDLMAYLRKVENIYDTDGNLKTVSRDGSPDSSAMLR
jgi:hypothetical protein